ncbi:MAG: DUF2723 domain-containing protein [Phycisphaerales bacterium]|nr:MAG: DUF2723 domain-containing protein [Phycisphaerales bacterium]
MWLLAASCATVVYLATMAPGVLWGDSGDAQIRVLAGELGDPRDLARSHVTYYGAAIALHKLFRLEAALAANLVSVLAGVITVANFAWLVSMFVRRRLALVSGVALLLLSHTLWQLSTGAEVMTSSTLCLSFELAVLVRFARTGRLRWLVLAGLANGIGWSTHNLALLTWPAYVIVGWLRWSRVPVPRLRSIAAVIAAWLAGCAPLAVLFIIELRALDSFTVTLQSLLVGAYSRDVFNTAFGLGMLARDLAYILLNFPTPLILLAPWGWWRLRKVGPGGVWWFLTLAALVIAAFAARYGVPDQYTFFVHAYLFLVLFAAIGVDQWLIRHPSKTMAVAVALLSFTAPVVYVAAPPLARWYGESRLPLPARRIPYRDPCAWFLRPWRTGYDGAERYAREVFAALPADAVLCADSTMRRPLDYLQIRDGIRPDVRLPGAPARRAGQTPLRISPENTDEYVEQGLLFCTGNVEQYAPSWLLDGGYHFEPSNLVYHVRPPPRPEGAP